MLCHGPTILFRTKTTLIILITSFSTQRERAPQTQRSHIGTRKLHSTRLIARSAAYRAHLNREARMSSATLRTDRKFPPTHMKKDSELRYGFQRKVAPSSRHRSSAGRSFAMETAFLRSNGLIEIWEHGALVCNIRWLSPVNVSPIVGIEMLRRCQQQSQGGGSGEGNDGYRSSAHLCRHRCLD